MALFTQYKTSYRLIPFLALVLLFIGNCIMTHTVLAAEEKVLNIYNWSNYIAEDTIKNFEKETGIKVRYDVFDTNEILHAKLMAKKSGYDIVVPTDRFAYLQIQTGLLKKLDKNKLPHLSYLDPQVLQSLAQLDPGNNYLVPWLWGYITVGINARQVKAALGNMPMPNNPWELIFNPAYASKLKACGISFMDSGAEVLPITLLYLGRPPYSQQLADYKAAAQMLKKVRPYVRVFSSSGYINDLVNGSLCAVMGYSGDINIAKRRALEAKNSYHIEALLPSAGTIMFFDTMAIPSDAPHPNNALLWINYILRPEVQASLTNKVFFSNPNKAAFKFITKSILEDNTIFLPDAVKKSLIPGAPIDMTTRKIIARTFTEFRTGL